MLHGLEGRLERLGLQAAAGMAREFSDEQPFGLVVPYIVIPRASSPPSGQSQLLPAGGGVNRATERLRIDEALHDQHRMSVPRFPIRAEPAQNQLEHPRTRVGHRPIGQQEKPRVVDHQGQTAPALLVGPANSLVARAQILGRRAEHQHSHPRSLSVHRQVEKPLPHRPQPAQGVMPSEPRRKAGQSLRPGQAHCNLFEQPRLLRVRKSRRTRQAPGLKRSGRGVQSQITSCGGSTR